MSQSCILLGSEITRFCHEKKKIIVVEDEPDLADVVTYNLEAGGLFSFGCSKRR